MRRIKRWLALMLTVTMAMSDCGSITVFATEDAAAVETSDSENDEGETKKSEDLNVLSEEPNEDENHAKTDSTQDEDTASETDAAQDEDATSETDTEIELPFLHIGQINEGEELPSPEDSEFVYDLPVSFEMSDSVLLFANYSIDTIFETEEKGTLVWSILRGEEGLEEGSASLMNEEDDWTGFEVVSESPYFTMTENEDAESDYYQTVELVAKAKEVSDEEDALHDEEVSDEEASEGYEDYNYYIRAAYYLETEAEAEEVFYAAVTIPVLPKESLNIEEIQDDMSDAETVDADEIQDDVTVADGIGEGETQNEESLEENDMDLTMEGIEAENVTADTAEDVSEDEDPEESEQHITALTLSPTSVEMYPGEIQIITATTEPEDVPAVIQWKSNDKSVATVDENGKITAIAEGYAQITAECDDITAVVNVEVAQDSTNKLLDLSAQIWIAGFKEESEDFVYTGQKITQDLRVYYIVGNNKILLKEKTDYTLTYKNNVNAAPSNEIKSPSVTVTMKGQYSGSRTLYYTIHPANINDCDRLYSVGQGDSVEDEPEDSPGYEQVVTKSTTLNIPAPSLTYMNKKLAVNKDFTCDYSTLPQDEKGNYKKGNYESNKTYYYTVNGIGNFEGSSFQMRLVVVDNKNCDFNSATVTLNEKQYDYCGENLLNPKVKINEFKLNKQVIDPSYYNYDVHAKEIKSAYLMIYPTKAGNEAGYYGYKKVNLKLVGDRKITDADQGPNWVDNITFSQKTVDEEGGIYQAKTGLLVFHSETEGSTLTEESDTEESNKKEPEPLTEGIDYTVKYSNAKKAGKVTVTFTGIGRYKGTLKKTYTIDPNDGKNAHFILTWNNVTEKSSSEGKALSIAYQKGGAVPDFVLRDQEKNILKNKTDYTVKLTNNKTPGEEMRCEITGKGNYKGYYQDISIMVTPGDIKNCIISIPDKAYSEKANAWQSKPTLTDVNGKKLAAGKDYDKEFKYYYPGVESGAVPARGSEVTVTISGIGDYDKSETTCTYRIYETSISALKITIETKDYTGSEITLSKADIHVYATSTDQKNKIEIEDKESYFEIVEESYKNNIKAGTAKVTLRGLKQYGGTKTYSFKIQKKAYLINQVKGITLDQTSLSLSLQGDNTAKGILTAQIKSADETKVPVNSTVIWTTSNSKVATVERLSNKATDGAGTSGTNETTAMARIELKGEGTVKITATTQDGGKKATCTVTIVDVPILNEKEPIFMAVDATYQLRFENDESPEFKLNGVKFETSNSEMVSVDNAGLLTANKVGAVVIKVTKGKYVQQCYAVVKGDEVKPEGKTYYEFTQTPGSTNDTVAIKNAIYSTYQNLNYDGIYIPAGVYWIDAAHDNGYGIRIRGKDGEFLRTNRENGFEIRLSPSALLMTIGNSRSGDYHTIWIADCKNITISGGAIVGERNEHNGTTGESGHGIGIYNSTNIHIEDMDISQCWGDGIYLGTNPNPDVTNNGITITNCNVHNNRRNNLSITDANGVTIDNCHFDNAKGTAPQFGIDIETNDKNKPCKNITISNSYMLGNAKASMGIMTPAEDVRLENCTLDGAFYNDAGKRVVLKNTTIKGEVTDKAGGITYEK